MESLLVLADDPASGRVHEMHTLTSEARHDLISVIVTRCLFVGSVALNAKASVGAALEERSHPLNDANPQGAALR